MDVPEVTLILGAHRSGTSLVAEIASRLGCFLGDALLGPSASNQRGHFEAIAAIQFNDSVLAHCKGAWNDPPRLDAVARCVDLFHPPLKDIVGGHSAVAIKDPRLCLTLPVWLASLQKGGYAVRVIHVMREPYATAASLRRRDGTTISTGVQLWAEYNRRACVYTSTAQVPTFVVWYDDLMSHPYVVIRNIAAYINQPFHATSVSCVDPNLRHERGGLPCL